MKSVQSKVLVVFSILVSVVVSQFPMSAFALQSKQIQVAATSKCTKYKFIGMRGSGQSYEGPSEVEALGPEMASLYGHLQTLTELKGQISYSGVRSYPAKAVPSKLEDIPEFLNSLGDIGPIELIKDYANEFRSCPDTKFIIAGYSQGAYAAHSLLDRIQSYKSYLRDSILGVILLANPTQDKTGIVSVFRADTQRKKDFKIYLSIFLEGIGNSASLYLDKALTEEYYIDPPDSKFLKTMSFFTPNDVVADFSTFFYDAVSEIKKSTRKITFNPKKEAQESAKRISASFKFASAIHSHYCAKSGKYASKNAGKLLACSDSANKAFLAESEKYIKGQLSVLKKLTNQKRQRVEENYGKGWQVPTTCEKIKALSELQDDLSYQDDFELFGNLHILAVNNDESTIWLLEEETSRLVSYSAKDGFLTLERLEEIESYLQSLNDDYESAIQGLSAVGLISNLVLELAEFKWVCKVDISRST